MKIMSNYVNYNKVTGDIKIIIPNKRFIERDLKNWKRKFRDDIKKRRTKPNYENIKISSFLGDKLLDFYFYKLKYVFCFSSGQKRCFSAFNTGFVCQIIVGDYNNMHYKICMSNGLSYEPQCQSQLYSHYHSRTGNYSTFILSNILIEIFETLIIHYSEGSLVGVNEHMDYYFKNKIENRKKKWNNY